VRRDIDPSFDLRARYDVIDETEVDEALPIAREAGLLE
jgi:hypothetical protein